MAMTRDEFVTEIADTVGKNESAAAVSGATLQTRIRTYLNWGQQRVARHHSFHELDALKTDAATVIDVKRYPLESGTNNLGLSRTKDIQSIRVIDSENSWKLVRWSYRKFDAYYPRPANYTTDRPRIYIRHGDFIELFKIPNAVYSLSIRWNQWATDFSTGSQTSDFKNKDQLITTAGVLETYLALEEYVDARVWYAKFLGHLGSAIKVERDIDWAPEAEPMGARPEYMSGTPWTDPYGGYGDPLYGYQDSGYFGQGY